jgi:peptide-methionine (S)-S-oxide reductase
MKSIVLGGGCFWCTEAVYQRIKGVDSVISGYAGGTTKNPNYNNHGNHAEVIKVSYDESVISLQELLEIFFGSHDPTTTNQPGTADDGPSYRSIILCSNDEVEIANQAKKIAQENWDKPIITEIKELEKFYPAEDYHQNFYNQNPQVGYCQVIINPKLDKLQKRFSKFLR